MVHQKLFLASGVMLLLTSCSGLPASSITETVPALLSTTAQPTLLVEDTVTETGTTTALIDTPSASPTEPSMLISTVLPEIAGEHHVSSGETLSCIGRAYGVLPKAIADINGIEVTAALSAGTVLKIPRIPWMNIPAGETCRPQFSGLFPTASVPNPPATTQAPPPTSASTSTGEIVPTGTSTSPINNPPTETSTLIPAPATATPISPTVHIPPEDTPTPVPSAIPDTQIPPTIHVPPADTPTFAPSAVPDTPIDTPPVVLPFPSLIFVTFVP